MKKRLLLALLAVAAAGGCAQSSSRPDPAPAEVRFAPLEYRSAFAGYRAFADEPIAPWPSANEMVKEAAEKPAQPQPGQEHRGHR